MRPAGVWDVPEVFPKCFGVFWARKNAREMPQKYLFKKIKISENWGENQKFAKNVEITKKSGDQTITDDTTCECCGRVKTNFKREISRESPKNIHKSKN